MQKLIGCVALGRSSRNLVSSMRRISGHQRTNLCRISMQNHNMFSFSMSIQGIAGCACRRSKVFILSKGRRLKWQFTPHNTNGHPADTHRRSLALITRILSPLFSMEMRPSKTAYKSGSKTKYIVDVRGTGSPLAVLG
jgi:hypothetical protein